MEISTNCITLGVGDVIVMKNLINPFTPRHGATDQQPSAPAGQGAVVGLLIIPRRPSAGCRGVQ